MEEVWKAVTSQQQLSAPAIRTAMAVVRFLVCSVVGILGLLALIFGLVAERNREKLVQVDGIHPCTYSQSVALPLGITAAFCILVAQIIATAFGGCVCCCAKRNNLRCGGTKTCAIVCLVLSWIISTVSFLFLLTFGLANGLRSNDNLDDDTASETGCAVPRPGGLIAGGCLAMAAAILAIIFYLCATSKRNQQNVGIPVSMPSAFPVAHPYHGSGSVQMPTAPFYSTKQNQEEVGIPVTRPSAFPVAHHGNGSVQMPTTAPFHSTK